MLASTVFEVQQAKETFFIHNARVIVSTWRCYPLLVRSNVYRPDDTDITAQARVSELLRLAIPKSQILA